jgi:hypothetical protein
MERKRTLRKWTRFTQYGKEWLTDWIMIFFYSFANAGSVRKAAVSPHEVLKGILEC